MDLFEIDALKLSLGVTPDLPTQYQLMPFSLTEESIPLLHELRGSSTYLKHLRQAATELHDMIASDETVRSYAKTGAKVSVNNKPRGVIAKFTSYRRAKTITAIEYVLHSLAHIASHPVKVDAAGNKQRLRSVGVPMSSSDYSNTVYGHLSYQSVAQAVYGLALLKPRGTSHESYIEYIAGRYNALKGEGIRTRIKPATPILDWMVSHQLVFVGHPFGVKRGVRKPESLLLVRDAIDDTVSYPLDRTLSQSEAILPELNRLLSRQRLDVVWPDYDTYLATWDFDAGRSKVYLAGNRTLSRQFVGADGKGGRLKGHCVQQLPQTARAHLTIDGSKSVEADFNAAQLRILYASRRITMPLDDLYDIEGVTRETAKLVLTRSAGCSSREETISSVAHGLRERNSTNTNAKRAYDAFWEHHADVWPHANAGHAVWNELQFYESEVALRVLALLLREGVAAIPIHDSFIVCARHAELLERCMREGFKEVFPEADVRVDWKYREVNKK